VGVGTWRYVHWSLLAFITAYCIVQRSAVASGSGTGSDYYSVVPRLSTVQYSAIDSRLVQYSVAYP
jgi:hypothetical protein